MDIKKVLYGKSIRESVLDERNMSYCRFENTYKDLLDCYEAMSENEEFSDSEFKYVKRMIELCKKIVDEYGDYKFSKEGEEEE